MISHTCAFFRDVAEWLTGVDGGGGLPPGAMAAAAKFCVAKLWDPRERRRL